MRCVHVLASAKWTDCLVQSMDNKWCTAFLYSITVREADSIYSHRRLKFLKKIPTQVFSRPGGLNFFLNLCPCPYFTWVIVGRLCDKYQTNIYGNKWHYHPNATNTTTDLWHLSGKGCFNCQQTEIWLKTTSDIENKLKNSTYILNAYQFAIVMHGNRILEAC